MPALMRRLGVVCAVAVSACALPARLPVGVADPPAAAGISDEDGSFAWTPQRRLQWSDFRGPVDQTNEAAALTSYVLTTETHCLGGRFSFRVWSRFLPASSWVKADHLRHPEAALTLQHERTHFDLSEVHARRARLALAALPAPCAVDDQTSEAVIPPVADEDAGMQAQYDRETAHGTDARRQAEWDERVRLWLRELPPDPRPVPPPPGDPRVSPVAPLAAATGPASPIEALVDRAAAYVREYQRTLTQILADEDYEQQVVSQTPEEVGMPRRRHTRSEVFFLFAGDWMAMRDVVAVDGALLKTRPDLKLALTSLPTRDVARRFKEYNSRYNVGRVVRNFNEPTLSLLLLDDRYRPDVTCKRKRVDTDRDGDWVTVECAERPGARGLIVDLAGAAAPSRGKFEVHAETGQVRFAQMTTIIGSVTAELTTTYRPDAHVGMLVPVIFAEHYRDGVPAAGSDPRTRIQTRYEVIRGRAEYRNYRRFQVKVLIR